MLSFLTAFDTAVIYDNTIPINNKVGFEQEK